jgi:hypothetical protein
MNKQNVKYIAHFIYIFLHTYAYAYMYMCEHIFSLKISAVLKHATTWLKFEDMLREKSQSKQKNI